MVAIAVLAEKPVLRIDLNTELFRPARNNINDTTESIGAVHSAYRPPDDFNSFDIVYRQAVNFKGPTDLAGETFSIYKDKGLILIHTSDRDGVLLRESEAG